MYCMEKGAATASSFLFPGGLIREFNNIGNKLSQSSAILSYSSEKKKAAVLYGFFFCDHRWMFDIDFCENSFNSIQKKIRITIFRTLSCFYFTIISLI